MLLTASVLQYAQPVRWMDATATESVDAATVARLLSSIDRN